MPTNRTTFLIDGFNLYHSSVNASEDLGGVTTKWLDIKSLCQSYLPLWGRDYRIEEMYYFSALAYHRESEDPGVVGRHQKFIECLKSTGIKIQLGNFKAKDVYCKNCKVTGVHHEEKETDVAISVKLLELFYNNSCDTVIIMSGDTDIAPAVRTSQRIFPQKNIHFLFPYKRKNKILKKLCPQSVKISKENYTNFQFSNPFVLQNGQNIYKPMAW